MRFIFYCVLVLSVLSTVIGDTISASNQEQEDLTIYEKELDRLFQALVEKRTTGNVQLYDSTLQNRGGVLIPTFSDSEEEDYDEDYFDEGSASGEPPSGSDYGREYIPSSPHRPSPIFPIDFSESEESPISSIGFSESEEPTRYSGIPEPPISLTSDDLGDRRKGSGNSKDLPPDNTNDLGLGEPPDDLEEKTGSGQQIKSKELFNSDENHNLVDMPVMAPLDIMAPLDTGESSGVSQEVCLIDIAPIRATYLKCLHDKLNPPGQQQTVKNTPNNLNYTQFFRSCGKTNELRACFKGYYGSKLELCPNDDASDFVNRLRGIADYIIQIICKNEGDRIMILIADGAIICLKNNGFKMLMCLNAHFNFMQETIFEVPSPKSPKEKCNDLKEAEKCFNQQVELCKKSLSSLPDIGMVGLVFDLARELATCDKPGPVQIPSSDSSITSEDIPIGHISAEATRNSEEISTGHISIEATTNSGENSTEHTFPQFSAERQEIRARHNFSEDEGIVTGHTPPNSSGEFETEYNENNDMEDSGEVYQEDSYNPPNGGAVLNKDKNHNKNTSKSSGYDLPIKQKLIIPNRTLTTKINESEETDNEPNTTYNYAAVGITLGLILAIFVCLFLATVK